MLKWVMELVGVPAGETTAIKGAKEPQLSRQEMLDLFSDDLARPVLQKRAKATRRKPRRLIAGFQPQFA